MGNIDYVIKRNNDDFVVFSENDSVGYNVVPRTVDPCNTFDIDEVRLWCEKNFDKVLSVDTNEDSDKIPIPEDIELYIDFKQSIDEDIRFLQKTDDVDFQLARHERGTEILSPEKLEECLLRDKTRGQISATLKQRKTEASNMFLKLSTKYKSELRAFMKQ